MKIRVSNKKEQRQTEIENIHKAAFRKTVSAEKAQEIVNLVHDLFDDETAMPIHSLVAIENEKLIGHVLFTKVTITDCPVEVEAQILAPLAVLPDCQSTGIGGRLIKEGLHLLKEAGTDLVFVLGHIDYYPRSGFINDAKSLGFEAPYYIPEEFAGAWMVMELSSGIIGKAKGKVECSDVLNQPQHWRE
ncbi:MAG: N-acetyltransferase [Desulfobacteraceae bacterium]|nr:N-acetyltransferase [Desulfobacteraceae bacterium]